MPDNNENTQPCEVCHLNSDNCTCWLCPECENKISENESACGTCHKCDECCDCFHCQECDRVHPHDYASVCENCEGCQNGNTGDQCCECSWCEGCDNNVSGDDYCCNCDRCADCCRCNGDDDSPVEAPERCEGTWLKLSKAMPKALECTDYEWQFWSNCPCAICRHMRNCVQCRKKFMKEFKRALVEDDHGVYTVLKEDKKDKEEEDFAQGGAYRHCGCGCVCITCDSPRRQCTCDESLCRGCRACNETRVDNENEKDTKYDLGTVQKKEKLPTQWKWGAFERRLKPEKVNLEKYSSLFTGYEVEASVPHPRKNITAVAGFDCDSNPNYGGQEQAGGIVADVVCSSSLGLLNAERIRMQVGTPENMTFKKPGKYAYWYQDASIRKDPFELVVRPLKAGEVYETFHQLYKAMKLDKADFFARKQAGLHMTVVNDQHQELSEFELCVVRNVIQLTRIYGFALKYLFARQPKGGTRGDDYCRLNPKPTKAWLKGDNKYSFVHLRRKEGGVIWGLEFRYPDPSNKAELVAVETKFLHALIRFAAKISGSYQICISQKYWDSRLKPNIMKAAATKKEFLAEWKDEAAELVELIKDELAEEHIYAVSKHLIENPMSSGRYTHSRARSTVMFPLDTDRLPMAIETRLANDEGEEEEIMEVFENG